MTEYLTKIRAWWDGVRDSLWFIPGLMTITAVVLAPVMIQVDAAFISAKMVRDYWWLFGGSPDGARGVLMAISTSLITVAGVVFSVTIVALQLASSQFTPRVLQNFMADRGNQAVLGVFIGTFTYTLLVLRTVRSPLEDGLSAFVPAGSVAVAVLLALISMGFLIYYIDHVASWIEASTIIDRVVGDTMRLVDHRYGEEADEPATAEPDEAQRPEGEPTRVRAKGGGYVQMMEPGRLFDLAVQYECTIEVIAPVGEFMLEGGTLALVWPADACEEDALGDSVRHAFALGHRRTITQDIELGLIQLSDIAVKAMSPGINDPTTAIMAVDRLGEVVAELGSRRTPAAIRLGATGTPRLILPPLRFAHIVDLAFSQIRRYAGADAAVLAHLLRTAARIGERVSADRREVLLGLVEAIENEGTRRLVNPLDENAVRERAARARQQLRRGVVFADSREVVRL